MLTGGFCIKFQAITITERLVLSSIHVLPPFVSSLPSCPPSLCVLPPFVSSLPLCLSSLLVLPSFMSIDEAEPVLLYLLGNFLSFCWGSP